MKSNPRVQVKELTEQQNDLTNRLGAAVEEHSELSMLFNKACHEKDAMQLQLQSVGSVRRLLTEARFRNI